MLSIANGLRCHAFVFNGASKSTIGTVEHDLYHLNPNPEVQNALQLQDLKVAVGVRNEDIPNIAANQTAADKWVSTNISPYNDSGIQYVVVGNEVIGSDLGKYVAPAMANLRNSLNSVKLVAIRVTTSVYTGVLSMSSPPSQGTFSPSVVDDMTAIVSFLNNLPPENPQHVIMVNVHPYFAYAADPEHISLEYALFTATSPVVRDGNLDYYNLFDAMVDAFYAALEKIGGASIEVVVSETGWPSAGNGNFTTIELAKTYNKNFMNHIASSGTPKRPNISTVGFIYEMFNEDQKPAGVEQNFGLFYPSGQPVYNIF
uniref:Glucan endo-1,3-beta-glucosidase GVI n=1 Tax=Ananas comosus var. bracteatus TaxID=296719 RepID=A0A6V7P2M2_ANACO|nr:unnamed protein product [Ananas comosus var. bracteatus]